MPTTGPVTTRNALISRGVRPYAAAQLAHAIDAHVNAQQPGRTWADLLTLVDATWEYVEARELPHALTLADQGVAPDDIAALACYADLADVLVGLDDGVPIDVMLRAARGFAQGPHLVADLVHAGAPEEILVFTLDEQVAEIANVLTLVRATGCTWEQVASVVTGPVGLEPVVRRVASVPADLTTLPAQVSLLAAELATRTGQSTLGLLPVAAALTGQPWEVTVRTLLTDQAGTGREESLSSIIATARALDGDPCEVLEPEDGVIILGRTAFAQATDGQPWFRVLTEQAPQVLLNAEPVELARQIGIARGLSTTASTAGERAVTVLPVGSRLEAARRDR